MNSRASFEVSCVTSVTHVFVNSKYVITATHPGNVSVLDNIEVGEMWHMTVHENHILVDGREGVARLWNADDGSMVKEFHYGSNSMMYLLMDESVIITGAPTPDFAIAVWDKESGLCRHVLEGHTAPVYFLKRLGDLLFSSSKDGTVRIWDLCTGTCLHELLDHPNYAQVMEINGDRSLLAVACGNGDIKIWRIADGTLMTTCQGHPKVVVQLTNRDEKLYSGSADGTVRVWNWTDGNHFHTYGNEHHGAVRGMAWTERYMISGGFGDGRARLWDNQTNNMILERQINRAIWMVVGAEGKVAVASKKEAGVHVLELWDMEDIDRNGL